MQLSPEEFNEFRIEAFELLDQAESNLLALDAGAEFAQVYDSIFRSFHNLKGSAGMLDLIALQTHMHALETTLTGYKGTNGLGKDLIDYFLKGCDRARGLFDPNSQPPAEAHPAPAATPAPVHAPAPAPTATPTATAATTLAANPALVSLGERALEYILLNYADLDTGFELRGEESERQDLQQLVTEILAHQQKATA